jgi:cobalamin biosynthesis Mg chelatase CobN
VVDHSKVKEVRVELIGDAPKVATRSDDVLLLNITQKVVDEYQVVEIRRTVSSEAIEDAIVAIADARAELERADTAVEAAKAQDLKVSEALTALELANEHLNNSQQLYFEGRPENATAEAGQAKKAAQDAEAKAAAAVGGRTYRNVIIGVIIVVLLVVVVVLFLQQRRRKRGVY